MLACLFGAPVAALALDNNTQQICADDLHEALTPAQLYDLLGRKSPSAGTSAKLFQDAGRQVELRNALNQAVSEQEYLQSVSELGLQFRDDFTQFIDKKTPGGNGKFEAVLFPKRQLYERWEAYKRTIKNLNDAPMDERDADLLARTKVSNRYGLSLDYTKRELENRPEHLEIEAYYNEWFNRYLILDKQKLVVDGNVDLRRFKIWTQKTLNAYQEQRAKNLIDALIAIAEFDTSALPLTMKTSGGKTQATLPFSTQIADQMEAKIVEDLSELESDAQRVELIAREKLLQTGVLKGVDARNLWKRRLGNYVSLSDREKIEFTKFLKKKRINAPEGVIQIKIEDPKFNERAAKAFGLKTVADGKPVEVEYTISLKDAYALLDRYTDVLGKTSLTEVNRLANQLLFTYYYEQALAENADLLAQQLETPSVPGFNSTVRNGAASEIEGFDGHDVKVGTNNLLERLRRLLVNQPRDALTGVEWYGYSVHNNFWINRDQRFVKKGSGFLPAIRDHIAKAKRSTQALIGVAALSITMYVILPYTQDLASLLAGKAGIHGTRGGGGSTEADGGGGKNSVGGGGGGGDGGGGGSSKDNPVRYDTRSYMYDSTKKVFTEYEPSTPRFFDYGTEIEMQDTAKMVEVKPLSPVQPLKNWPQWKKDSVYSVVQYRNTDSFHIAARNGYVFIPRPEGHVLEQLMLQDTGSRRVDVYEKILYHPQTGQYAVKLKPQYDTVGFNIQATFVKWKPRVPEKIESLEQLMQQVLHSENEHEFKDKRFAKMSVKKLQPIVDSIRAAGLTDLANQYDTLFEYRRSNNQPVTMDDVANVIAYTQWNEAQTDLGADTIPYANRFERWKKYVQPDGKIAIDCDVSNILFGEIITQYFKGQKDIRHGPYESDVVDSTAMRDTYEDGWVRGPTHQRRIVISPKEPDKIVMDATPVNKLEKKKDPEPKPEPKKPVKRPWFLDWPETTDPRRRPLIERPPAEPIPPLSRKAFHEDMLSKLEQKTDFLGKNEVLRDAVKRITDFPPQRAFLVATHVQRFGRDQIGLDELFVQLVRAYPELELSVPKNEAEMVEALTRIEAFEAEEWQKYVTWSRQLSQGSTDLNSGARYYWSEDATLKKLAFDLFAFLKSYHWHSPKEVP